MPRHVNVDTYTGWDSNEGNVWYEDKGFLPCWSRTYYIMTTWKSRIRSGTLGAKMRIPTKQISIIMVSLETYEFYSNNK
jgi:hypothetical protein